MEFIILDLDNASIDQVRATIDCNCKTAKLMRSEVDKLKKAAICDKNNYTLSDYEEEDVIKIDDEEEVDQIFEDEVNYYLESLRSVNIETLEEDIDLILPSRKHYEYNRIVLRLILECKKSIKEIIEFINEEELSLDDLIDIKSELGIEQKRVEIITNEMNREVKEEEKEVENKIILVPTQYGNIRILDDIDHIDLEFYDKFLGLINSIRDNTFKNVKRFKNLKELEGLSEVKDFKVRVLYKRLNRDTYAVISAFIKKNDNDLGYRTAVRSKYAKYLEVEPTLKENINNLEFLEENDKNIEELYRKLTSYDKTKVKNKSLKGDL